MTLGVTEDLICDRPEAALEAALAVVEEEDEAPPANIDAFIKSPTPASWSDTKHSEDGEASADVVSKEAMHKKGLRVREMETTFSVDIPGTI